MICLMSKNIFSFEWTLFGSSSIALNYGRIIIISISSHGNWLSGTTIFQTHHSCPLSYKHLIVHIFAFVLEPISWTHQNTLWFAFMTEHLRFECILTWFCNKSMPSSFIGSASEPKIKQLYWKKCFVHLQCH